MLLFLAGTGDSGPDIWIIVGCVCACVLLIALVVVLIFCWKKHKRPGSSDSDGITKRVLWSRANTTVVRPLDINKEKLPPGSVVQTNIFDLDLPTSGGKANLLPPLTPPMSSMLFQQQTFHKETTVTDIDTTPADPE